MFQTTNQEQSGLKLKLHVFSTVTLIGPLSLPLAKWDPCRAGFRSGGDFHVSFDAIRYPILDIYIYSVYMYIYMCIYIIES